MTYPDDEHPDLKPGNTKVIESGGHELHVTATKLAVHTGRRRYMVECVTCKMLVHPGSTSADAQINYHLRDAAAGTAKSWPNGLVPT